MCIHYFFFIHSAFFVLTYFMRLISLCVCAMVLQTFKSTIYVHLVIYCCWNSWTKIFFHSSVHFSQIRERKKTSKKINSNKRKKYSQALKCWNQSTNVIAYILLLFSHFLSFCIYLFFAISSEVDFFWDKNSDNIHRTIIMLKRISICQSKYTHAV